MKKTALAPLLLLLSIGAADAADVSRYPKPTWENYEKHREQILQKLEPRMGNNPEGKECLRNARSAEELKACRSKLSNEEQELRQKIRDYKR